MIEETKPKEVVKVFWTGGFDSTFRILQLSMLPVKISPYYLLDNRKSESMELAAINKLTDLINSDNRTSGELMPITIIAENERGISDEITEAYNRLLKESYFGSQYDWLAGFAAKHRGIELSIHKDDKALNLIKKHGKLKEITDKLTGKSFILDKENSSDDVILLFQNYRFPLVSYTKLEIQEKYLSLGYKNIMDLTWFCHSPMNNEPCGECNPCKYTIEEGLSNRFSKQALRRYRRRKYSAALHGKTAYLSGLLTVFKQK